MALFHNIAPNMDQCLASLELRGLPIAAPPDANGSLWCNATWDSVLCWKATPANTSTTLPCPPLKGLDPRKTLPRKCEANGTWQFAWKNKSPKGWTNFSICLLPNVKKLLEGLDTPALERAQQLARGTRKLEFVGLGLSFVSLLAAILIIGCFRRLRVFRNQVHLQLMVALLMVVIIRVILYVDLVVTEYLGNLRTTDIGYTINTKPVVCEAFYFMLEYFKTVTFAWMFIEGFYLHNTVVVTVFNEDPKLWKYLIIGWGFPLVHSFIWLLTVVALSGEVERCLGSYYLNPEFWVLDGLRMLQLWINLFFLLNIIRVLWLKVREAHIGTEMEQLKKSVKGALMLVPLLGIPNIMQTIPFAPTVNNINYFAVYTYVASFCYMFQGFMVAILYCFTNREVINVLKSRYKRYQLRRTGQEDLRRGSRPGAEFLSQHTRANGHAAANGHLADKTAAGSPLLRNATDTYSTRLGTDSQPLQHSPAYLAPPPYESCVNATSEAAQDTGTAPFAADRQRKPSL